MNDLLPLFLLWAFSNRCPTTAPGTPAWPSVIDPPPPPPPPPPLPPPDATSRATPDATSQATRDAAEPTKPAWPGFIDYKPPKAPAKKTATLDQLLRSSTWLGQKLDAPVDVSVANIQAALTKRGFKIKKDGLYGPATETAFQAAAVQHKLPHTITKRSPKLARVVRRTWLALSSPVIP